VIGTLVSTYQYDPYGNLLSSTGSVANPWRFAGGYFDSSTGLYKFGTRYYNPGFGRWSQQDPVRGQLNDPTSLNRYLYAGDDPVNVTDPSGRDWWDCFKAGVHILFALLGAWLASAGIVAWLAAALFPALLSPPTAIAALAAIVGLILYIDGVYSVITDMEACLSS